MMIYSSNKLMEFHIFSNCRSINWLIKQDGFLLDEGLQKQQNKIYIELHKCFSKLCHCVSLHLYMPKLRKFKKYDYSKSYDQIKEEEISRPSQPSLPLEDESSARKRGRRSWGRKAGEKSEQNKSMVMSQQDFREELVDEFTSHSQHQANQMQDATSDNFSYLQNEDLQQETQPILQHQEQQKDLAPVKEVEIGQQFDKKEKKEKRNEETVTIHSNPSPVESKLEDLADENAPESMMEVQLDDACALPEEDNEQFILQFNPGPSREDEPGEVFRSSFIYNNDYIRVEVYLDSHRRAVEERIRAMAARKNPESFEPEDSRSLKAEFPRGGRGGGEDLAPLRRRKKRRTAVTAKVLEQVQLLFRHYEEQEKFYGTPCYRRKLTLRNIGDSLSISATEIKHLYDEFTTDPLFTMRFGRLQPQGKCGVASQQLQEIRLKFIEELVGRNCVMTQQEIADEMNQCQELLSRDRIGHLQPITRKMVQILLKKGNYSRKKVQLVPKNRNSPQTIENRYHYCKRYLELLATPDAEIYFLDESRFNMMTMRDRGWAKKGIPATKTTVNSKGKDIILLAIISISGLVWYQLSDGYNAAAFTISIDRACKILNQRGPNPHRYIILDNCPIHNRQNLRSIEQLHSVKMVFLPPYTPMLNPIEYWFNEVKSNFRQKTYKTRLEMKNSLDVIITKFREKSFENYYGCIKPYLELGVRRELTK